MIELVKECYGCKKPTEPHEWFDGVPVKGQLLGFSVKKMKRFVCSKCGHKMSVGLMRSK